MSSSHHRSSHPHLLVRNPNRNSLSRDSGSRREDKLFVPAWCTANEKFDLEESRSQQIENPEVQQGERLYVNVATPSSTHIECYRLYANGRYVMAYAPRSKLVDFGWEAKQN